MVHARLQLYSSVHRNPAAMDFTKITESKSGDRYRDQMGAGLILLTVGVLLLAGVALVASLFDALWDVLLLRDIVAATTALPAYLLILVATGLILKGFAAKILGRRGKGGADPNDSV